MSKTQCPWKLLQYTCVQNSQGSPQTGDGRSHLFVLFSTDLSNKFNFSLFLGSSHHRVLIMSRVWPVATAHLQLMQTFHHFHTPSFSTCNSTVSRANSESPATSLVAAYMSAAHGHHTVHTFTLEYIIYCPALPPPPPKKENPTTTTGYQNPISMYILSAHPYSKQSLQWLCSTTLLKISQGGGAQPLYTLD